MTSKFIRRPSLVQAVLVADLLECAPGSITKKGEWPEWLSNARISYPDGVAVGYGGYNDLQAKVTDYLVRDAKGNIYKVPEEQFIVEYDPYRSVQGKPDSGSR